MRLDPAERLAVRLTAWAFIGYCIAAMGVGVFSVGERLWLVNAESYPRWLASGELGAVTTADLRALRKGECGGQTIEVYEKQDQVIVRCGFAWYSQATRTYVAEAYTDAI